MANKSVIKNVNEHVGETVVVGCWVNNKRSSGKIQFLQLRDGTGYIQGVVVKSEVPEQVWDDAKSLTQESSLYVTGIIREEPRSQSGYEMTVTGIEILHLTENYPITPKEHGVDFLMDHRHLWLRSAKQRAVLVIRAEIIRAIQQYFDTNGFTLVDPPILTPTSAEGTTNLFHTKYFEEDAYLTQSGQLYMEAAAMALGRVYSFGPTFRAENSNTSRHLAEFWMIEPELAFADLNDIATLAEDMLKYVAQAVLTELPDDMQFFAQRVEKTAISRLEKLISSDFVRMDYTDAIEILQNSGKKFEFPVKWGVDLSSEHERYLAEEHVGAPIIMQNYPRDIKAFYMRQNEDGKTVAAMDVLAPGIGEIIGGSQREERLDVFDARLAEMNLDKEDYSWYRDLRRYGTVPHSGFGLGFERLVAYVTGMQNVRDVIAFPRAPGTANY